MKNPIQFTFKVLAASILMRGQAFCQTTESVTPHYTESEGFVAHEWGTFTTLQKSNGVLLTGLEKEEEPLPGFVKNLCYCFSWYYSKDHNYQQGIYSLKNVKVKMETPVIYFYSTDSHEKPVAVEVLFKNGSISQWYPERTRGESVDGFFGGYLRQTPPLVYLDFASPRTGYIRWDGFVLPLNDTSHYTNKIIDETSQWRAQRATAANLVKIKDAATLWDNINKVHYKVDEIEKFLFYRGIANFVPPLKVEFNTAGNLVISNTGAENISYVMVYEKRKNGKVIIWGSDTLAAQHKIAVRKPVEEGVAGAAEEMEKFVLKLTQAGLYKDEAKAMLKTWEKSYFEHEGLKVFWIVSRPFTDEVLPINIEPQPNALKRVLVGRSEILSPEFEKEIAGKSQFDIFNKYQNDRFILAYMELANNVPLAWTDYNEFDGKAAAGISQNKNGSLVSTEIYPNPFENKFTVRLDSSDMRSVQIKVFDAMGATIKVFHEAKANEFNFDAFGLRSGMYVIKVEYSDGRTISKKLMKSGVD